jgi:histidinol-phosphate phosphatase family protein
MSRGGFVILDRDGVINYERPNYVKDIYEFRFIEGAIEAIRMLSRNSFKIIVVTNQSAVGRNLISKGELENIHRHMCQEVARAGGRITSVYYCPHAPESACECRKPKIGLFLRASADLNFSLADSWFVGDQISDLEAGKMAGCKTFLITSNRPYELMRLAVSMVLGWIRLLPSKPSARPWLPWSCSRSRTT